MNIEFNNMWKDFGDFLITPAVAFSVRPKTFVLAWLCWMVVVDW